MKNKISRVLLLLLALHLAVACQKNGEKKHPPRSINDCVKDSADLLTADQEENIYVLIRNLEKEIGSQIAIVTINSLEGEDLNQFSIRTSEEMSLGRDRQKDGVLITVVYKDRQTRIEVGYGLERIIRDEIAAKIINERMIPRFKEQNMSEGIYAAVEAIKILIEENRELVGKMP